MKKKILLGPLAFSLFALIAFSGGTDGLVQKKLGLQTLFSEDRLEITDPELIGPDRLCNVFGSVLGDFFGGGDPETDVYYWKIFNPGGDLVFDRFGGALLQSITYTFSGSGVFRVTLEVERAGKVIYEGEQNVALILGPIVTLKESYLFCENEFVEIHAIDPTSPDFADYVFEWRDDSGTVLGTQNTLQVSTPGTYSVSLFLLGSSGQQECEINLQTQVDQVKDYQIIASETSVCPDLPTVFSTTPATSGTWKYLKSTETTPVIIGFGNTIQISPNQILNGEGDYQIIFEPDPQVNPSCLVTKSIDLLYNPQPEFLVFSTNSATDCDSFDGELTIEAVTPLDQVEVEGLGINSPALAPGQQFTFSGLKSGTYSLIGILGNCSNTAGSLVPLANPPQELVFDIVDIVGEKCLPNGKSNGSFKVQFQNPPSTGNYRVINQKGTLVQQNSFTAVSEIVVSLPGGVYYVEVFSDQDCNVPEAGEVSIPSLNQTNFSVPSQLSVCESFDLVPQTTESLIFTLTHFPSGEVTVKNAGEAFTLTEAGEYSLIGTATSSTTVCPTERKFTVTLVDPVEFEPLLIKQDCFGNLTYQAEIGNADPATVVFRWMNDQNEVVGTGQIFNPTSIGLFKLDVQPANSEACPIPPKEFVIKEPILSVDVSLETTKLCEFGPRAVITLSTTFPEEVTDIEWRRFDEAGQITELPEFKDRKEITVDVAGTYEASVFSIIPAIQKSCELGRKTVQLDLTPNKVSFEVPASLSICDPYSLIPESTKPLIFSLTYPDGKVEIRNWNEEFILDQAGTYTILGYDADIKGPLCPEQKTVVVTVNPPVQFEPILGTLLCDGTYEYLAKVENYLPDEVDYFWRNSEGVLVGSEAVFFTSVYGTYSLEVQPTGSIPCTLQPVTFEIPPPVLNVDTRIEAETLCPDQPDAALAVIADFDPVKTIEWWYTDLSNNRTPLLTESGKTEILAKNEGTYEVRLMNEFGCLLGTDETFVVRSTDQVRPEVEESYQVCPRYEIGPVIDPGNFAQYEWYFDNNLVSTSPTFKPLQIGMFRLVVYSEEGCAYESSFVTEEECELRVQFPNAIQPGNPEKPFLIYTNYLIDELEIWIFNKWGNQIFHCASSNLKSEESTCLWDGLYDGKKIPPGSYAYRIQYKNLERNIEKLEMGTILVID